MPEITSCPDCEKKLRVPDDLLGKKVRCPGCGVQFIARAGVGLPEERSAARAPASRSEAYSERRPGPPAAGYRDRYDDDYDDRRGRRDDYEDQDRPRDTSKAWRGVRLGLNFVIIAGWLTIGMVGVAAIGMGMFMLAGVSLFTSVSTAPANQQAGKAVGGVVALGLGVVLFAIVIGLINLAEAVLRLVGYGVCIQVPSNRDSAAKGLVIAAFSCACAAVALNLFGALLSGALNGLAQGGLAVLFVGGYGNAFGLLAGLIALGGFVCWLLFLRSVALQLRGSDVAGRIVTWIIVWLVFGGAVFVIGLVIFLAGIATAFSATQSATPGGAIRTMGAFAVVAVVMACLVGLVGLALYVWYILLVTQVRHLVDRHLARR
jgi:hypothetical protein